MHVRCFEAVVISLLFFSAGRTGAAEPARPRPPVVATFSIVAFDPQARQWGIAVQSRVLAVGSIVPFGRAGVGAIATQSYANTTFGPRGLQMLSAGKSAQETLDALLADDPGRQQRQVAIVDSKGGVAHFTGERCLHWAGAKSGEHFVCLGNILAGPEVVEEMAQAFTRTEGMLADRLMAAMQAGQKAGGDRRGQQSAALLVLKEGAGYAGFDDRMIDLRVDDHRRPLDELQRLLDLRLGRKPAPATPQ